MKTEVVVYLDTSIVLAVVFGQMPAPGYWGRWDRAYVSDLMVTEARRAVDRLRLDGALDDDGVVAAHDSLRAVEERVESVRLTRRILARAGGSMPVVVKTLDAIHVATALALAESRESELSFATLDKRQERAAKASGLALAAA